MKSRKIRLSLSRSDICLIGIVILYVFLCLCRILSGNELSGDEFFSLEDSYGRAFHGISERWDFVTNQGIGVSFETTKKFNLYFILLGYWMKLFGVTEISMRLLSMCWGVVALVSVYYLIKQIWRERGCVSICEGGVLLLAFHPYFLAMSTTVREYTMLVCLNIWIFHFIYKALNGESFGWRSMLLALLLFCIAFFIRIFEVLYLSGIGLYIVYKAIRTRKKRFLLLSAIEAAGLLFMVLILTSCLSPGLPIVRTILKYWNEYAMFSLRKVGYWKSVLQIIFWPASILALVNLFFYFFINHDTEAKQIKDVLIFCICIVTGTLVVFTFLVNWPESARYILPVCPVAMVVLVHGFALQPAGQSERIKYILYGVLSCCIVINFVAVCPRHIPMDASKPYSQAYEKLVEYNGKSPFFITGIRLRGYYANDILGDYTWQPLTSKVDDDHDISHLEEFTAIGQEHPEGYLTCETERYYHLRNSFWEFLNTGVFEKISGDGIDNTGVNIWAYHMAYPMDGEISEESGTTTFFGANFGCVSRIVEKEGYTILQLTINGTLPKKMILGIKLNQYYEGECKKRYAQLVLLPDYGEKQYYEIVFENNGQIDKSELDHSYSIYDGEACKSYEDCYNP